MSGSSLPTDRVEALSTVRGDLGPPAPFEPLDSLVLGVGGGGCNVVSRIFTDRLHPGRLSALNTDAQHLLTVKAHHKVLLGRNICRGRSANSDPRVGELAAEESRIEIAETLRGSRLTFLVTALGGGTGSGATPVVAKVAREMRATTVALATHPFAVEGALRAQNARACLDRLQAHADFLSVFPNERLLAEYPGLSFRDALLKADLALFAPVAALHRAASRPDFPRLRRRLRRASASGAASATSTRQRGYPHAIEAALAALEPLRPSRPNSALLLIGSSGDLTPAERDAILSFTLDFLHPAGTLLWGYYHDPSLRDLCEASAFLARLEAPPDPNDAPTDP